MGRFNSLQHVLYDCLPKEDFPTTILCAIDCRNDILYCHWSTPGRPNHAPLRVKSLTSRASAVSPILQSPCCFYVLHYINITLSARLDGRCSLHDWFQVRYFDFVLLKFNPLLLPDMVSTISFHIQSHIIQCDMCKCALSAGLVLCLAASECQALSCRVHLPPAIFAL